MCLQHVSGNYRDVLRIATGIVYARLVSNLGNISNSDCERAKTVPFSRLAPNDRRFYTLEGEFSVLFSLHLEQQYVNSRSFIHSMRDHSFMKSTHRY